MNTALKYNIYQQHCPARLFFEKIADKWVLLIINVLADETQHFNLLKKNIQGISPKVLSQKLKMLERDDLSKDKSKIPLQYVLIIH
jgi:DNA-binding HxlR family transcriptional regulator